MRKKRFSPKSEQHHGFTIFDISSVSEDYRLAFRLNKALGIHLVRQYDLNVYLQPEKPILHSLYSFAADKFFSYFLIHNQSEKNPLIKSYLLILEGHVSDQELTNLIEKVSRVEDVLNINLLNLSDIGNNIKSFKKKIKHVNTILTDLEYHLIELKKSENETKIKLKPDQTNDIRKLYD